jgi:hypothetical protein
MKFIKDIHYKNQEYTLYSSPLNNEIIEFVRFIFKLKYNADIVDFKTHFLLLRNNKHEIAALIGYANAVNNHLMIEDYLEGNVEAFTTEARDDIIEVGNLSAKENGLGLLINNLLIEHIIDNTQYKRAFLAGNAFVLRFLRSSTLLHNIIGDADKNKLKNPDAWGTYYDLNPKLVDIDLETSRNNKFKLIGEIS